MKKFRDWFMCSFVAHDIEESSIQRREIFVGTNNYIQGEQIMKKRKFTTGQCKKCKETLNLDF
jgi:hypothetical protein